MIFDQISFYGSFCPVSRVAIKASTLVSMLNNAWSLTYPLLPTSLEDQAQYSLARETSIAYM